MDTEIENEDIITDEDRKKWNFDGYQYTIKTQHKDTKYLYCLHRSKKKCQAHGKFFNGKFTPTIKDHTCDKTESEIMKEIEMIDVSEEDKSKERKMAARLPKAIAIDMVFKYIDNFTEESFPAWSSEIWKKMSKDSGGVWTSQSFYINVREDRRGILTEARKKAGLPPLPSKKKVKKRVHSDDSTDDDDDWVYGPDSDKGESWFNLVLTNKQWVEIKPPDGLGRKKIPLRKNVWTNIIADAFWDQYRLPCAYVFKYGHVYGPSSKYYIIINGRCRSKKCGNKFYAVTDLEPEPNEPLRLRVRTRNTMMEEHEEVRRPINGERRRQLAEAAAIESIQNPQKRSEVSVDLKKCSLVPDTQRILEAKKAFAEKVLDCETESNLNSTNNNGDNNTDDDDNNTDDDNIETDSVINDSMEVDDDDADAPFLILFSTPEQSQFYREYCNLDNVQAIGIDKTGNLIPFV
ncbi:uncharacterized protein LOC130667946 [Microplitis mediator]|uniref:uncharacterized protein LOC130667946 n=1 Tax=Microplitis mediator TaxID=375433 RepID=UPI002552B19D|nr:uncharacterized protein LOC130667946 [Microplitis mediator]